jgi:hypothetical protein
MSPDLQELEAKLGALRPAALDPGLLARLADSASGDLTTLPPPVARLEASLRGLRPAALPAALAAALELPAVPEPVVIPFPTAAQPAARARHWNRPMLAAAAAVAILGASAALFMPRQDPAAGQVAAAPPAAPRTAPEVRPAPAGRPSSLVPAAFNTGLSEARDEGVVWQDANQPRRVVKVVYWDRVTLVDAQGRKVEVEKPRIEYLLVPEKID